MQCTWDQKGSLADKVTKVLSPGERFLGKISSSPTIVSLQEVAAEQWWSCVPAKGKRTKKVQGKLGEVAAVCGYRAIFCKAKGTAGRGEYIGMLYDVKKAEARRLRSPGHQRWGGCLGYKKKGEKKVFFSPAAPRRTRWNTW